VSVSLDADLVAQVEKLASDRTAAIEAAIRQWCEQQEQQQQLQQDHRQGSVQRFPTRPAPLPSSHRQQDEDETGWLV
jgi:hypothetical protein